jgi:hypothetical protein
VKYANFHEDLRFDHLVCETIGTLLAKDLGLPVAEPCLIEISPEFLDALPMSDSAAHIRAAFGEGGGVAFGSVAFNPVRRWTAENIVHKNQRQQATRLYLFDTLTENSDRGIRNPNLLVQGHDFKVIDQGHCFQRCADVDDDYGRGRPWDRGGIKNHYMGDMQHVLFEKIHPADVQDIQGFTMAFQGVSDAIIQSYMDAIPIEWGQDTACRIVDYLLEAQAEVRIFEERAKEVLL